MQLKVIFILLLLIAQNAFQLTNSIALNTNNLKTNKNQTKMGSYDKNGLNSDKKVPANLLENKTNTERQILKKEKYHSQTFLELRSKIKNGNISENKSKLESSIPNFSFGNFDFAIAFQLLAEILKNGILSDNGTTLAQECFRVIYRRQGQFFHALERFYSLMFGFYVSEKFLKNTQSANENFINGMNQIKKILDEAQDNYVILNGYRRSCFEAFKFVPNFNKEEVLKILIKAQYFGDINDTYGAQPFIDSQFSIYRYRLPQNAFKLLNYVSRGKNGSGSALSGNGSYNGNFLRSIMLDAKTKGLNLGSDGINNERRFGRDHISNKKEYLYRPNITYELGNNASKVPDNSNKDLNNDQNKNPYQNVEINKSDKDQDIKFNQDNKAKEIQNPGNKNEDSTVKKDDNAKPSQNENANEDPKSPEQKKDDSKKNNQISTPNGNANGNQMNNKIFDKNNNSILVEEASDDQEIHQNQPNNPQEKSKKLENKESTNENKANKNNHNNNNNDKNNKSNKDTSEKSSKNNSKTKSENKEDDGDCMVELTDNTQSNAKSKNDSDENKRKNRKPEDAFNLAVFGNFGEIEYFKDLSKLENEQFSQVLPSEKLSFDNANKICYINFETGEQLELNTTKGLNNYNKLLANRKTIEKMNAANNLFLIGDIVNTGINHEIYHAIEKTQKVKLLDRVQCAWNLFLDSLTKTGFAQSQEDGSFLVSEEVDILPGSPALQHGMIEQNLKIFDSIQTGKNINEENTKILLGDEQNANEQGKTKTKIKHSHLLVESPKLTTIKFKDFYIQFLDFNSYLLICLSEENEAEYKECLKKNNLISSELNENSNSTKNPKLNGDSEFNTKVRVDGESTKIQSQDLKAFENQEGFLVEGKCGKKEKDENSKSEDKDIIKSNEEIFSLANARKYAWKLYETIKEKLFNHGPNFPVWKFMRAVHAPVSTINGDSEFYFKMIKVLNAKGGEEAISLIETMAVKNVNFFIASQAKAAQVLAYPYSRAFKTCKCVNDKNKTGEFGCSYTRRDKIFKESAVYADSEKCLKDQKNIQFDLPINFKSFENKDNLLYVFNVGNSGAGLEKIHTSKTSNAYVIWERSIAEGGDKNLKSANYGFANFAISKDYIDVKFYEMTGKNEVSRTGIFSISEGIMPDQTIMSSVIEENFCTGNSKQK